MSKQALEGKRLNAFGIEPEKLVIIGLDTDDGPEHPLYDERVKLPVDEQFVQLMIAKGFKSTISVRKNGPLAEVVAGRQRVKTAREANKRLRELHKGLDADALEKVLIKVKCMPEGGDDTEAEEAGYYENSYRFDDPPLIQSNKIKRYLDRGNSEKDAALIFHCSVQHIKNMMRLHDLDASVRKAVERGDLKAAAAAPLADLTREDQKVALEKLLAEGGRITERTTKGATKDKKNGTSDADATVAPTKREVTRILKLNKETQTLSEEAVHIMLWMLGDFPSNRIKGLVDLQRRANEKAASRVKASR